MLGSVLLLSPLLVEGISVVAKKVTVTYEFLSITVACHRSPFQSAWNNNNVVVFLIEQLVLYLPSFAHLENSGVILLEGIPPLQQNSTTISMYNSPCVLSIVQSIVFHPLSKLPPNCYANFKQKFLNIVKKKEAEENAN